MTLRTVGIVSIPSRGDRIIVACYSLQTGTVATGGTTSRESSVLSLVGWVAARGDINIGVAVTICRRSFGRRIGRSIMTIGTGNCGTGDRSRKVNCMATSRWSRSMTFGTIGGRYAPYRSRCQTATTLVVSGSGVTGRPGGTGITIGRGIAEI